MWGPLDPGELPDELLRNARSAPQGGRWLAGLDERIEHFLRQWMLRPDPAAFPAAGTPYFAGHTSIVLPVQDAAGTPLALKLSIPAEELLGEARALGIWNGNGAVRLLDHDENGSALLLERMDPRRDLGALPLADATVVWGSLVRRLAVPAAGGWPHFEHTAAIAERFNDTLPEDWERLDHPVPLALLEEALRFCQLNGTVGRHHSRDVLVHADLHYFNILAGHDDPLDFRAIDPQAVLGDAEYAVLPMLDNRIRELPAADPASALRLRCTDLARAAALDPRQAVGWSIVRAVADVLRYTGRGQPRDAQRSLWVALALAAGDEPAFGGALAALPHAHQLKPMI